MFSTADTIVAIATPPGRGGIGVVRLSGPDAHAIAQRLTTHREAFEPRHATFTKVRLKPDPTYVTNVPLAASARDSASFGEADPAYSTNVPLPASARDSASFGEADPAYSTNVPLPASARDSASFSEAAPERAAESTARDGGKPDSTYVSLSKDAFSRTYTDAIDHAVVTYFPAPASYTADDVVEISAHGSPVVLRSIVSAAIDAGARLAEPGEFTLRAFLNGRLDLMQAEAVADLIDAATPLQARAAFDQLEGTLTCTIREIDATLFDLIARLEASVDFPEEGYHFVDPDAIAQEIDKILLRTRALLDDGRRGRLLREGLHVAIVGRPNVGKSSLFNALVGTSRAIVTDVPGTTRDLVTEVIDLDGLRVTLVDTAGLRETTDAIESEGVARSKQSTHVADLVLQVIVEDAPQTIDSRQIVVQNKSDLQPPSAGILDVIPVSAKTGAGLTCLRRAVVEALTGDSNVPLRDRPEITNVRHIALVQRAHDSLERAKAAARTDGNALPEEFVLADLQDARAALEEITGRRTPDDTLAHIFERFCIGK